MNKVRFVIGALALFLCILPAFAERQCIDNYQESGSWAAGKSFQSRIEIKEADLGTVQLKIARTLARDGYLGINSDRELGIVSAFQENNGKKSTLNFVLLESAEGTLEVEFVFRLAAGLRMPRAAAREEICALLEGLLPEDQRIQGEQADAGIVLRTPEGKIPLESTIGELRQAGVEPFVRFFFDFPGAQAAVRIDHQEPEFLIRGVSNPTMDYTFVRVDSDPTVDLRSVKVASAGKVLRKAFTGRGELAPDKNWRIPLTVIEEAEGLWRITPKRPLKPGEYGLWDIEGFGVVLFGVD